MANEVRTIAVERFSVTSARPFDDVLAAVEVAIGHPDMTAAARTIAGAGSYAELEQFIRGVVGPSELMEFARYDIGAVLRKSPAANTRKSVRLVVGNPLIMRQMAEHVPDTGSYAPVTILIDERADGVHLTYDRMASLLAPYRSPEALKTARDLDSKVEALLTAASR